MELEELKRLSAINEKAILSKTIDPLGTEYDIVKDFIVGLSTLRISTREIKIPGITRNMDLVIKAVAEFKDKKKRNIMPIQYAKSDDIVVESVARPQIFGLTSFTKTTSSSAPSVENIIPQASGSFSVDDDELIIITDWIELEPDAPIVELQGTIDGTDQYPVSCRLPFKATDLHLFELDFPWIADVSLDIDGRSETASATTTLVPIGVHVCLGKLVKSLVPS